MDTLRHSWAIDARSGIAACVALCFAGCSVQSPPVVTTSVGNAPSSITEIHILEPDSDQTQRGQLYVALTQELADRGVAPSGSANLVADLAISVSPGTVGVYASEAGKTNAEPDQLATTRKRRWYDSCEAVRIEASLAVYNRSDGTLQKSSDAESISCADSPLPVAELASVLADDLLAD